MSKSKSDASRKKQAPDDDGVDAETPAPSDADAPGKPARVGRDAAMNRLRQELERGRWRAGDMLPPERELARELGLTRGLLRTALVQLAGEGILESRQGSGHRLVRDLSSTQAAAILGRIDPMDTTVALRPGSEYFVDLAASLRFQSRGVHVLNFNAEQVVADRATSIRRAAPMGIFVAAECIHIRGIDELVQTLVEDQYPLVCGLPHLAIDGVTYITPDHEQGMYDLTRSLIERGRARILCCYEGRKSRAYLQDRLRGYRRAMSEAGLDPLDPVDVPRLEPDAVGVTWEESVCYSLGFLYEHLRTHRDEPPIDAIAATTDQHAAELREALTRLDLPELPMLAGFDNCPIHPGLEREGTPDWAIGWSPALTVDKNNALIGETAAELLLKAAADPSASGGVHRIPGKVIAYASADA